MNAFIIWNALPEVFKLGALEVRWYGLLFALGFFLGNYLMIWIYKLERRNEKDVETLLMYMLVGTVLGARLGHCFFYDFDYYMSHPLEILQVWKGGLASHGGAFGILLAIYLYARKHKDQPYLWLLDRIVIGVAIGGACIRTGNFMNSEILGYASDKPWAVFFANNTSNVIKNLINNENAEVEYMDMRKDTSINNVQYPLIKANVTIPQGKFSENTLSILPSKLLQYQGSEDKNILKIASMPYEYSSSGTKTSFSFYFYGISRHPAQLYEAISCFLLFLLLAAIYLKYKENLPHGRIFGIFLIVLFALRFFYEYLKEVQNEFEYDLSLKMGQWLSIPLVIAGIIILIRSFKKSKEVGD